jgi:cysteine desulfurase
MVFVLDEYYGNPSSLHSVGSDAKRLVDQARIDVAEGIGSLPDEILFTSGATEADNLALFGTLRRFLPREAHLITSATEHHAILHAANLLEREGYSVTRLPVDRQGLVDPDAVRRAVRPETKLISIMLVNNEVGSIQPVREIGRIARDRRVAFHTDAVQAVGLFAVDVDDLNVDMLSLSGHKIYGPKGIGALFIHSGVELSPMIVGGSQERSLRAGTENVVGIVGLGEAMKLVRQHRSGEYARLSELRKYLIAGLQSVSPGVIVNGPDGAVAPHILSVSFTGADAEMMLIRMNSEGIAVSMGSACNSKSIAPSHVLTAMGLPNEQIESTLRFSLGMPSTREDVDYALHAMEAILPRVLV